MKLENLFVIDFKNEKLSLVLILWLFCFLLHNFLTGIWNFVSALFFILAILIIPAYFVIAIVYSFIKWMKQK
jgi:hypothetical protein